MSGERPIHGPGEVLAEMYQGFRNKVARGEIAPAEAIKLSEDIRRSLCVFSILGYPSEQESTQLTPLMEEGKRIQMKNSSTPVPVKVTA